MVSWIVIIILIIAGIFAIKMNHLRHRIFIILLVLLALFLYTTINFVTQQNNLDFKTVDGVFNSIKIYTTWLANGFQNIKSLVGRATQLDWKSTNKTINDDKK